MPARQPSHQATRRQVLASAAVGIGTLLAGCVGEHSTTQEAADRSEPPDDADALSDPDYRVLRTDTDRPFVFTSPDDADADADDTDQPDERPPRGRRDAVFVLDEDAADALHFDPEPDGVDEIRTFVDETDFAEESIVVDQRPVEECYEMEVVYVTAGPDEFRSQFCNRLREPDVACEADRELMQATVIRVPHAYEEEPSSRASGWNSSCSGLRAEVSE